MTLGIRGLDESEEVDSRSADAQITKQAVQKEADDNDRRHKLFRLAFWSVILMSSASFLLVAVSTVWDTYIDGYVLVAFISGSVVQSYILVQVIARSLYPRDAPAAAPAAARHVIQPAPRRRRARAGGAAVFSSFDGDPAERDGNL